MALRFVHISDTHINADPDYISPYGTHSAIDGARALVAQVNALPYAPDFVLHTGDVTYDPLPEPYQTAREILGQIKYPVYYLAGNHDDSVLLQRFLLDRPDGQIVTPLHYEFTMKGVQIACVDSNGPVEPPRGYMIDSQLGWLARICTADDDRPLVVAVHHNIPKLDIPWWDHYMGVLNGDAFHDVVKQARHRLRGVFFGHIHQNINIVRDGVLYSGVPSSWCQFHSFPGQEETVGDFDSGMGFNVVTITPTQTLIRRYRFGIT